MLSESGADVNKGDPEHGYPLQPAAASGNAGRVQTLLEAGADVHAAGGEAGSALTAAAGAGHTEILNILIKRDADVNLQGGTLHSALQAACARQNNYECVKTPLDYGADVHMEGGLYGSVI